MDRKASLTRVATETEGKDKDELFWVLILSMQARYSIRGSFGPLVALGEAAILGAR